MDETLLKGRTIHVVGAKMGFLDQVIALEDGDMVSYLKNTEIARLLTGLKKKEVVEIFQSIALQDHLTEVISYLKAHQVKTAIVTNSYQFLADDLKKRLGFDYAVGNTLVIKDGIITGELQIQNTNPIKRFDGCRQHPICKQSVLYELSDKSKIDVAEMIAVGDGRIDMCMLKEAGLGVAFNAPVEVQQCADISTTDLRTILSYV